MRGLIAAIVFAAIAAVVVLRMTPEQAPPPPVGQVQQAPQLKTVNIYVAAQPIPIGTIVAAEMLAVQPWPEHLVLPGFIQAEGGAEKVIGTVTRSVFQQQEPIIETKLANPNDPNFLAGELPKGMRVVTVTTSEIEGVAGFVFPGDHVDVMLTHDVDRLRREPGTTQGAPAVTRSIKEPVTETVLTNVKVLAVDQRSGGAPMTNKDGGIIIPRSVSLMVSPTDAQRIRLAQKVGTLTLALRALADRESADPMILTNKADVTQYKSMAVDADGASEGDNVAVYRGAPRQSTGISSTPGVVGR